MTKYIDADALQNKLGSSDADIDFCHMIDEMPAAPVRPEVHAYWKEEIVYEGMLKYEKTYKCMNEKCLKTSPDRKKHPFCPHCGATMDAEGEKA